MKITFVDPVTPKVYTQETLETSTLGGTEASVLRLAQLLAANGHEVTQLQRGRDDLNVVDKNQDLVITLRDSQKYRELRAAYPKAKHILWLHDVMSGEYREHTLANLHGLSDINLVTVSDWHKTQVHEALRTGLSHGSYRLNTCYNLLAEYCIKGYNQQYDPYKLVYFSSPHKGLDYVLTLLKYLRIDEPRYYLVLANPGYFSDATGLPEGVKNLGPTPHKQIIDEVRTALCTFYPQIGFPETFGLVMAESNAVGTPVISHELGAAPEVLDGDRRQLLDCRHYLNVIERVQKWTNGERPVVKVNHKFTNHATLKQWEKVFRL
jgi:glycosyltransferase involved in cell wall biosynthesis